jgi:hypothetical protein
VQAEVVIFEIAGIVFVALLVAYPVVAQLSEEGKKPRQSG